MTMETDTATRGMLDPLFLRASQRHPVFWDTTDLHPGQEGVIREAISEIERLRVPNLVEVARLGLDYLKTYLNDFSPLELKGFLEQWAELSELDLRDSNSYSVMANYFKGFVKDGTPVEVPVILPLYEIHSPHVPGCETTARFERLTEREAHLDCHYLLGTFSGGVRARFHVKREEFASGECCTLFVPSQLVLDRWVFPHNPYVQPFYTVRDVRFTDHLIKRNWMLGKHYCGHRFDAVVKAFRQYEDSRDRFRKIECDYADVHSGGAHEFSEERMSSLSYRFALGVPLHAFLGQPQAPALDLSIGGKVKVLRKHGFRYVFSGGRYYIGFCLEDGAAPINFVWT